MDRSVYFLNYQSDKMRQILTSLRITSLESANRSINLDTPRDGQRYYFTLKITNRLLLLWILKICGGVIDNEHKNDI